MENIFESGFDDFEVISDELVCLAETTLDKMLPDSYKSLLSSSNGGYLKKNAFPTTVNNNSGDGYVLVDCIFGISSDLDECNSILITPYMTEEWGLPPKLVLLSGDGHTWIALDYRTNASIPTVSFVDIEAEQEIVLASNFQQFIDGLIVEPETEDVWADKLDDGELDPNDDSSVWIDPAFAKEMGIEAPHDGWIKKPRTK